MTLSGPVSWSSLQLHVAELEALGIPHPGWEGRGSRPPREKLGPRKALGNHPKMAGRGWCAHMSGVVRTRSRPRIQAASALLQTPGCVARRNEVSLGESALDSHTRLGGLGSRKDLDFSEQGFSMVPA